MGVAPELQQVVDMLRDQLSELHAELVCNHLVVWTAGNIAARVPGHDLMVIKHLRRALRRTHARRHGRL